MSWSNTISSRGPVEVTPSQTSSGSIKGMNCITTSMSIQREKREREENDNNEEDRVASFCLFRVFLCFFSSRYYCATTSFSTESAVTVSLCVLHRVTSVRPSLRYFIPLLLVSSSLVFSLSDCLLDFPSSSLHHHRLSIPLPAISLSKSVMMSS